MRTPISTLAPTLFALIVSSAPLCANAEDKGHATVDYLRDIKPLLIRKCSGCHGALQQQGSLRLDTRSSILRGGDSGPAVAAGKPETSELLARVVAAPESRMPPEGEPVTPEQVQQLRAWIAAGAPGPESETPQASPENHWAFQPIPAIALAPYDMIDSAIEQRLQQAGLKMAPPAAAHDLVRRMFLVMHGLPPTPTQTEFWTRALGESAPGSRLWRQTIGNLIDSLLASPRYGERWAQHWLDLVRYADTHGFEVNTPRENAWHYRDYVIEALNEDLPYDRFILEQLAGDTMGADAATGFLVAAAALLPGQIGKDAASKRLARQDSLDEIVVGVSATFMGLTVGCARCHDHKFDPIAQKDYYSLQAFFAGVDYGERPLPNDPSAQAKTEELRKEIAALEAELVKFQPLADTQPITLIDDEQLEHVQLLAAKNGHGVNPSGAARGYKDDPGGDDRGPNASRGRYTWWDNVPGQDVFAWRLPAEKAGDYRIWISWGVHGSGVHTRDARYVLDQDGNLETQGDQAEIARVDQYRFARQASGDSEKKPLWSGFLNAGIHALEPGAKLVLRGGDTGTGITADVIAIQSAPQNDAQQRQSLLLRSPVSPTKNIERFKPTDARFIRFTVLETVDQNRHEPCIDELEAYAADSPETNLALTDNGVKLSSSGNLSETGKHQLKHINDGLYGNDHSWISNEQGRGWVQLELPKSKPLTRIVWGRDRKSQFKDRLAIRYRIEVSRDGKKWTTIAASTDRAPIGTPSTELAQWQRRAASQSSSDDAHTATSPSPGDVDKLTRLREQLVERSRPRMAFAGKFRSPDPTHLLLRGDPEQPQGLVEPATPSRVGVDSLGPVMLGSHSTDADRRVALARWITSSKNPLTARVIANRVWQHHFGIGFVDTPSDFGMRSSRPSHPELLDGLARYLIDNGWSLKRLHRLILSSQAFQQATRIAPEAQQLDGENRLLWRYPSRRLEAEAIRDSILQSSGALNLKMGGPGFNFFKSRGGLSGFPPVDTFTPNQMRRMIYSHKVRMESVPVFGAFDCPDAGQPAPRRSSSTTAIQALNLFNSPFVYDQAKTLADSVVATAGDQADAKDRQVRLAFQRTLGRPPTESEREDAAIVLLDHDLAALCRVLFNTSEFLFIP